MIVREFLKLSSRFLRDNSSDEPFYWSWCTWTTFGRLEHQAGYWSGPLPLEDELDEKFTRDGGMWTQPFSYEDIAHIIIPRSYSFERLLDDEMIWIDKLQNLTGLSSILSEHEVDHRRTELLIELKLY